MLPKKVLITTAIEESPYDYIATNLPFPATQRLCLKRKISFGLRFLKENIPDLHILEYPSWDEYAQIVELGWDAIGFSYYTYETPRIVQMVSAARSAKIPQLWGGNYGVLSHDAPALFDRIVYGYAEKQIGEWMGSSIDCLEHPALLVTLQLGDGMGLMNIGILFTVRGCNKACTFCQTPQFCGRYLEALPLDTLDRAIDRYRKFGVGAILILDECFGIIKDHCEAVVQMLEKSGLPWLPMTRSDILMPLLSEWGSRGLAGALLGIENFHDSHLKQIHKGSGAEVTKKLINRLQAEDRIVVGFYIIGFEDDTRESVEADLKELAAMELDVAQVCILTPLPRTTLWQELAHYGIDDGEMSRFDGKHLVWNHPQLNADELEGLLHYGFHLTFPEGREIATIRKFARLMIRRLGLAAGMCYITGVFMRSNASIAGR